MSARISLKQKLYESAITLVRDPNHLIPISQHPLPYVCIGNTSKDLCAQKLLLDRIEYYELPAQASEEQIDKLLGIITQKNPQDPVIISVHQMNRSPQKQFGISKSTQIFTTMLARQGKKIILVLFGNAYSIRFFEKAQTILVAYEDEPEAQRAAALVLTGEIIPTGQLPV